VDGTYIIETPKEPFATPRVASSKELIRGLGEAMLLLQAQFYHQGNTSSLEICYPPAKYPKQPPSSAAADEVLREVMKLKTGSLSLTSPLPCVVPPVS
jgi:hypothetical protein